MNYSLVIFDLDGTLLDTLEDLKNSLNHALGSQGFPGRSLEEVRAFVGNGMVRLVQRAVPERCSPEQQEAVFTAFRAHYRRHSRDATRPYPGIPELLRELRQEGIMLAVLSNKVHDAVGELCDFYFPGLLDAAAGLQEGVEKKPDPAGLLLLLEKLGVKKEQAVYIGDSEVDVETARSGGLDCIAVDWGFRSRQQLQKAGADCIAASPEELKKALKQQNDAV